MAGYEKEMELRVRKLLEQAPGFTLSEGTASSNVITQVLPVLNHKHKRQKNFHPKGVTPEKIIFWTKCCDEIKAQRPDLKSKLELARRIEKKCVGEFAKHHNAVRTIRDNI